MSHAVLRGKPNASQLYLDGVLDAVREGDRAKGRDVRGRDRVNLAEVIYYCMRKSPNSIRMINGTTGIEFTNEQMLRRAVSISRALSARGASGKPIMIVMRNHDELVSLYYGALFAGVIIFLLDPLSTEYELRHFVNLVEPCLVFCDQDRVDDVTKSAQDCGLPSGNVFTNDGLKAFADGHSSDLDSFVVTDAAPESTALFLPTSGSTGLPKAVHLTHLALVSQLPMLWSYHSRFPKPTESVMFMSTAQWMTFTNLVTTCPVYNITMLISPGRDAAHAVKILEKFRPTWAMFAPGFAKLMLATAQPHQMTSLETLLVTGATPTPETMAGMKKILPKTTVFNNGYGMTETQGFAVIPNKDTPFGCPGKVFNIFNYKLVDEDGNEIQETHTNGELYLKNDLCIIKGYLRNEAAYLECVTEDGWWKTGDVFFKDELEQMHFVQRKKFWFKYLNYHISPEELENVISSVPGVQECVACGSEDGAAAAVVVLPGCEVTRDQIHSAVDASLIEYKRLRAGIAFVETLPRTHSGKLHRMDCTKLVNELIRRGECF